MTTDCPVRIAAAPIPLPPAARPGPSLAARRRRAESPPMQVRLVDPTTWQVVRTYGSLTAALADPAMPSGTIMAEADSDEAAVLQASQRWQYSCELQARQAAANAATDDPQPADKVARLLLPLLPLLRRVVEARTVHLQVEARQHPELAAAARAEQDRLVVALDAFDALGVR